MKGYEPSLYRGKWFMPKKEERRRCIMDRESNNLYRAVSAGGVYRGAYQMSRGLAIGATHMMMKEVRKRNVSLESADLRGVSFDQTDLSGSVLAGARIDDGALDRAILCNTVLPNGNLANPSSTGCEGAPSFGPHDATIVMTPANPLYPGAQAMQDSTPAVPFGTVVNGCRMQVKAKCPYVNLSAQNLSNVELSLSDLRGANFEGVGATSMNAPLSKATRLRGAGGNFQVAGFGFSDLTKADLTKAELSFAAFSFADLDGANMPWLSGAGSISCDARLRKPTRCR